MNKVQVAQGFILQGRTSSSMQYGIIWFNKDTKQVEEEVTGGTGSFRYDMRLPDRSVVDQYVDARGYTITWTYFWGGSMYPMKTEQAPATGCQLSIAVVYETGPGTARMYVNGAPAAAPLYLQVDGGAYQPITLVQDSQGMKYELSGLSAGSHQLKLSTTPNPCQVSRSLTMTTGASAGGANLTIYHIETVAADTSSGTGSADVFVRTVDGSSIPASVIVEGRCDDTQPWTEFYNHEGNFVSHQFTGLAPGSYTVSVRVKGQTTEYTYSFDINAAMGVQTER